MTEQKEQPKNDDILDDILDDASGTEAKPDTAAPVTPVTPVVHAEDKVIQQSDLFGAGVDGFLPGVGVDIGTSNIVVSRCKKDGTFVSRHHRNMLYELEISDEASDLLDRGDYMYVKVSNCYYIVGEDALKLVNAIGKGEVVRPMKDGILNPSLKDSTELLFYIIKAVVGDPIVPNESLRFSIPANPVDRDVDNLFHQMTLQSFFTKMGYTAKPINEAMCICYDCNPTMIAENEDTGKKERVLLSGLSVSCGAGMTNVLLSYKGVQVAAFSITKSGDYIDKCASQVTGIPIAKMMKMKERELDLSSIDESSRGLVALSIYYGEFFDRILHNISKYFVGNKSSMDGSVEVVVAGGTSMPKGFCDIFFSVVKGKDWPFDIYAVRHSDTPFYSVCNGACIRAQADQQKNN